MGVFLKKELNELDSIVMNGNRGRYKKRMVINLGDLLELSNKQAKIYYSAGRNKRDNTLQKYKEITIEEAEHLASKIRKVDSSWRFFNPGEAIYDVVSHGCIGLFFY
eukprot:TRINITY_DN8856_c0_g2_i1.p1 TRINITY_DN8856_c0_g2~~TRINITY_DN8856_c0_g2_i1.p1  ORF type:complete len:107 (-),score=4.63 TRINITY_DN8856_c0_g2_i1:8-328(-)